MNFCYDLAIEVFYFTKNPQRETLRLANRSFNKIFLKYFEKYCKLQSNILNINTKEDGIELRAVFEYNKKVPELFENFFVKTNHLHNTYKEFILFIEHKENSQQIVSALKSMFLKFKRLNFSYINFSAYEDFNTKNLIYYILNNIAALGNKYTVLEVSSIPDLIFPQWNAKEYMSMLSICKQNKIQVKLIMEKEIDVGFENLRFFYFTLKKIIQNDFEYATNILLSITIKEDKNMILRYFKEWLEEVIF